LKGRRTVEEQKTRSIKELAPKPSDAIKAMLEGLRELPGDEFEVDMGSFGRTSGDVCYGCAATCAVFRLGGKVPRSEVMLGFTAQADYLQLNVHELRKFEIAIDHFRMGFPWQLFAFYRVPFNTTFAQRQPWCLQQHNFEEQLSQIEEYIRKLEAAGF
jgi:hypothetical protein